MSRSTPRVLAYSGGFEVPQLLGARAQLYHAAIQVGLAAGALGTARVRDREARPFFEAARGLGGTAAGDPHVSIGSARWRPRSRPRGRCCGRSGGAGRDRPRARRRGAAARGSIAVAQAKAFDIETAVAVASDLFSMSGASAADDNHDLSRYWRNARTHASHDPVDWKYHHVGNYLLSGVPPPNHGQL